MTAPMQLLDVALKMFQNQAALYDVISWDVTDALCPPILDRTLTLTTDISVASMCSTRTVSPFE